MQAREVHYHGQDLVVGLAADERRRQLRRNRFGLQEQPTGRRAAARRLERNACRDVAAADCDSRGHQLVKIARGLPRVARDLGHAFLVAVELLERKHRQEDVVLFKTVEAGGIVHQHVGVEHEELGESGGLAGLGDVGGETKVALDHEPPYGQTGE